MILFHQSYSILWWTFWLSSCVEPKEEGSIKKGLILHWVEDCLSILQHADGIIIFMDDDIERGNNMELLLYAFEQLSGCKISFHKRELFCNKEAKNYMENIYISLAMVLANILSVPRRFNELYDAQKQEIGSH